jgi:hypothetical protein
MDLMVGWRCWFAVATASVVMLSSEANAESVADF